jgi:hypothetical protein
MAAKKNSKQQSKASFVRSLPASLSAADVVEKAKAAGISLEVGYVYNIRSTAKAAGKGRSPAEPASSTAGRGRPKGNGSAPKAAWDSSSAELLLKAVGAELGLASAIRILESERARVRAALGK